MGECWICVDGVEGTGKTTITNGLASMLSIETAPEFSAAPFGQALAAAVRTSPHHISSSPIGQSLIFIGDFLELHSASVAPRLRAGISVISDRGYLSKYAYQEVVLSSELGAASARRLLDTIFAYLPPPALTIYLTAPIEVLYERLIRRDGHCDVPRRQFMIRAAEVAEQRLERAPVLDAVTVDTNRTIAEVLAALEPVVREVIRRT
jgi:thymidylate kinase